MADYRTCQKCGKFLYPREDSTAAACTCPPEPEPPKQYAQGWVCPICGRVSAPWASSCPCWMDRIKTTYGNTTTVMTGSSNITNQDVDELTDDLHELCVRAVNVMVEQGVTRHISYITPEDNINFQLDLSYKIPKVTIEWVNAQEAEVK